MKQFCDYDSDLCECNYPPPEHNNDHYPKDGNCNECIRNPTREIINFEEFHQKYPEHHFMGHILREEDEIEFIGYVKFYEVWVDVILVEQHRFSIKSVHKFKYMNKPIEKTPEVYIRIRLFLEKRIEEIKGARAI